MPIADSRSAIRKYLSARAHFLTGDHIYFRDYSEDFDFFIGGNQMTNASVVEEPEVGFDYSADAELFPARNRKSRR